MALYISWSPSFTIAGVVKRKVERHPATGEIIGETPYIDVDFRWGRLPSWAEKVGLEKFDWSRKALPEGVNPVHYLSSYDTIEAQNQYGWDDELRERVERVLDNHPNNGDVFLKLEAPLPDAPWQNYEKTQWKQVISTARELGLVDEALVYEQATQRRKGVLEGLEAAKLEVDSELVAA